MPEKPVPSWLKPLWVRLFFVALPAAWGAFEATNQQWTWAALFGASAAWGLWTLVIKFKPDGESP